MDVEPGMLLKLKLLENKLTELVDKIDKEIIQTDVEWMHLKNVVESTNKVSESKSQQKPDTNVSTAANADGKPPLNMASTSKTTFDEQLINAAPLELDINSKIASAPLMEDEEFDSD